MRDAIRAAGVPVELSDDAGAFACNAALYLALAAAPPGAAVGFLHVPVAPWPFGPRVAKLARAVEAALQVLAA